MYQVKQGVDVQKDKIEMLIAGNFDYYEIIDPVYNKEHINLIISGELQRDTKTLADHFNSVESLVLLYNDKLEKIQVKVKSIILISFVAFITSLVTLFYTFGFLSDQKYSFIPITAVFLISLSLITMALYFIKEERILGSDFRQFAYTQLNQNALPRKMIF